MVINQVSSDSDLAGKQVKQYDMIVAVNGKTMTSTDVMTQVLSDSKPGDTIKLTTQLGTRSYEVYSVSKIGVDDTSILSDSTENIITLVTCVMNQPDYRWCVQAKAS